MQTIRIILVSFVLALLSTVSTTGCDLFGAAFPEIPAHHSVGHTVERRSALSDGVGTLEQLEQAALESNPAISKLLADLESLRGKHLQAGLPPNPTMGYVGSDINENGSSGRHGLYVGRQIIRGNKLSLAQSVVCAEIAAAEQRLNTQSQRLLVDVRTLYYQVLVAQEKRDVARELVDVSQKSSEVTTNLYRAREVAKTAVLQAEVEYHSAVVRSRRAENEWTASRRKLAALLGQQELQFSRIEGDPRALQEVEPFEIALIALQDSNPELNVLRSNVVTAKRNLARQTAQPIPDLTWQASLQYDFGNDELISGVQAGIPVPIFNRNQGAVHQARYRVLAAQHDVEKKSLELQQRLAEAFQQWNDARLQINAYQEEILPRARESYQLVLAGYQQGELDFLQLLTAQRTYSQINLDFLDQLRQYWQQHIQIKGQLLSGSLSE